jgi:hypothetical protein
MEKKVHLWTALILGVPVLRVVEVACVSFANRSGLHPKDLLFHFGLGLIIGIGCAMSAQLLKISDRRLLWALPCMAMAYAGALLCFTYHPRFFHQDPAFVSTLLLMDLGSWAIAVFGASVIGYVATRPSPPRATTLPHLGA